MAEPICDGEPGWIEILIDSINNGTVAEVTAPGSSHTNGATERMLRHLQQLARAVILTARLPKELLEKVWS